MTIVKVPQPRVVIYHPDNTNIQVLLFDEFGGKQGEVEFTGTPEQQHDLAYEYREFKVTQLRNAEVAPPSQKEKP